MYYNEDSQQISTIQFRTNEHYTYYDFHVGSVVVYRNDEGAKKHGIVIGVESSENGYIIFWEGNTTPTFNKFDDHACFCLNADYKKLKKFM